MQTRNAVAQTYREIPNQKMRDDLILEHLPLVKYVIGRLGLTKTFGTLEFADIENQGILGLIEAVDRYDAHFGSKLSTYAILKIRGKILDYLREIDWMPRSTRERVKQVQSAIEQLEKKLERQPTDKELADFLGLKERDVKKTLADGSRMIVSLDKDDSVSNPDGGTSVLYEKMVDPDQRNPSTNYEEIEYKEQVIALVKNLSEREQLILSLYYIDELTFKEIGAVLDLSESRICQIHSRAIFRLRRVAAQLA